jgi:hypothetical protein
MVILIVCTLGRYFCTSLFHMRLGSTHPKTALDRVISSIATGRNECDSQLSTTDHPQHQHNESDQWCVTRKGIIISDMYILLSIIQVQRNYATEIIAISRVFLA